MTKKLRKHGVACWTIITGLVLGAFTGFVGLVVEPLRLFSAGMVPADDPLRQSWKYPLEKALPMLLVAVVVGAANRLCRRAPRADIGRIC